MSTKTIDKLVGGILAWLLFLSLVAWAVHTDAAAKKCVGKCKTDFECWQRCQKAKYCPAAN